MKGFTLIELLAVIVILAIILLISVPLISSVIESVKKSGFESSINSIVKAAEREQVIRQLEGDDREVTYSFDEYNQTVTPSDIDELKFNGTGPKSGTITVGSTAPIEVQVTDGEYYIETDGTGKLKEAITYVVPVEPTESLIYKNRSIVYSYEAATTKLTLDDQDDGAGQINLGFDFNFGGTNGNKYSTIYPTTNGAIAFTMDDAYWRNNTEIDGWFEYPIIAPHWTDLMFNTALMPNAGIYYTIGNESGKNYVLIEWRTINNYDSNNQNATTTGGFEVKLYEDGTIKVYYQDVEFEGVNYINGLGSTLGVFATETNYNQYSHNTNSITSGTAIEYYLTPGTVTDRCFGFDTNTQTIFSYDSRCPKDVVIPSTINGTTVTNIGTSAFEFYWLTSVTIPNSVINIGAAAFYQNLLTSVTIGNSVTSIGNYAFEQNALTSVTIPNSVTSIGDYAFRNNQLTSVTIGAGVTSIGRSAFYTNDLTSVVIPNSVTSIGESAFAFNQLASVIIPNNVIIIADDTFRNNQLASVIIPNSVTNIGEFAFYNNKLTSVTIGNSVTSIGFGAFQINLLTSVTIPSSVITISEWAFEDNRLTSIWIPNSVTSIRSSAFYGNRILQGNAIIDNASGNVSILSSAFNNNGVAGLTNITPVFLR